MSTSIKNFYYGIKNSKFTNEVNKFLNSVYFLALSAVLAVLGNAFGLELLVYGIIVLCGIFTAIFGEDFLPLLPAFAFCYITPSTKNNPGKNPNSVFTFGNGAEYLVAMVGLFAIALIVRLIIDKNIGIRQAFKVKRKLTLGMVILGVAYILSGLFSKGYFTRDTFVNNLIFSVLQFVSLFAIYFIFAFAVKWEKVKKEYFLWIMFFVALVVMAELVTVYIQNEVAGKGNFDKALIYTGWGICNNMGALMVMAMPASFYFAYKRNHGWIFSIIASLIFVAVIFSMSRASMLFGAVVYALCVVMIIVKSKGKARRNHLIVFGILLALAIIIACVFYKQILGMFATLVNNGLTNDSGRGNIYKAGLKQFIKAPIFGSTFFPVEYDLYSWSSTDLTAILPPRWHNTIVQLLASCGVVGLLAYAFHRFETVKLFLSEKNAESTFIAVCILGLLLTSLLDCHFFNLGPTMLYSMALLFVEKAKIITPKKLSEKTEMVAFDDTVNAENG